MDHRPFEALLEKYVDGRGLVNYAAWQKTGLTALREYTEQFSRGQPFATGDEQAASLINDQSDLGRDYQRGLFQRIFR